MQIIKDNRNIVIIITIIIIIIGILVYYIYNNFIYDEYDNQKNENTLKFTTSEEEKIVIYIVGEVKKPGIIKLKEGDRICDAIDLAGGITEYANLENVNLAYVLSDGLKIKIPNINEINISEEIISKNNGEDIIENNKNDIENKIYFDINKATKEELIKVPGIGDSMANRILNYRKEIGKFNDINQLMDVSRNWRSKTK